MFDGMDRIILDIEGGGGYGLVGSEHNFSMTNVLIQAADAKAVIAHGPYIITMAGRSPLRPIRVIILACLRRWIQRPRHMHLQIRPRPGCEHHPQQRLAEAVGAL